MGLRELPPLCLDTTPRRLRWQADRLIAGVCAAVLTLSLPLYLSRTFEGPEEQLLARHHLGLEVPSQLL